MADHALAQAVFHLEQLFGLALEHLVDRDAGPISERGCDVILGHDVARELDAGFGRRLLGGLQAATQLGQRDVLELAELGEVLLGLGCGEGALGVVDLLAQRLHRRHHAASRRDLLLELSHLRRQLGVFGLESFTRFDALLIFVITQRSDLRVHRFGPTDDHVSTGRDAVHLHALARRRLVQEVHRRLRQGSIREVAFGQDDRSGDRALGDAHAMMALIALGHAADDLERRIDARRFQGHHRETPQYAGVFLLQLLGSFRRGGGDDADLTAR